MARGAGVAVSLLLAGCISHQAPREVDSIDGAATPWGVLGESWTTNASLGRIAIKLRLEVGPAPGTCSVRMGMSGGFTTATSVFFFYEKAGDRVVGWNHIQAGAATVQQGEFTTDSTREVVSQVDRSLGWPTGGYSFLLNISRDRFDERIKWAEARVPTWNSTKTLEFVLMSPDVTPKEWGLHGGDSLVAEYSCEGGIRTSAQVSRKFMFIGPDEFDRTTLAVSVMSFASAAHEAFSERDFEAPVVEIVAGPGWAGLGTPRGALDIVRPGGNTHWQEGTGILHVDDGPGTYRFTLSRAATIDPAGPCNGFCSDLFFLSAAGWSPMASLAEIGKAA